MSAGIGGDLRQRIPASLRACIRDEQGSTCWYCQAPWASEPDHVIPVAQGGRSVRDNLVLACRRCNAQKGGRTPAQWKCWRVSRGLSWPPVDCTLALGVLLHGAYSEPDSEVMSLALRAAYPPLMQATVDLNDLIYDEVEFDADAWRASLRDLALNYSAEVST